MTKTNAATTTKTTTNMMHIVGTHKETGNVVSIYREDKTAAMSVQLMKECGYNVTVQNGYTVNV